MLDWLLGMAAFLALFFVIFNPRSFFYGLVALFAVAFFFPGNGVGVSLTACAIASWVGLLAELYNQMDFDK